MQQLADAVEVAAPTHGLTVAREREGESFVRFSVSDSQDECELDLAIDHRALDPVETSYGPAFDLRELGANKVLAIFDRAEPRDFIDLAQLTKRFPLEETGNCSRPSAAGRSASEPSARLSSTKTVHLQMARTADWNRNVR